MYKQRGNIQKLHERRFRVLRLYPYKLLHASVEISVGCKVYPSKGTEEKKKIHNNNNINNNNDNNNETNSCSEVC